MVGTGAFGYSVPSGVDLRSQEKTVERHAFDNRIKTKTLGDG